jgi:hypothetical protein
MILNRKLMAPLLVLAIVGGSLLAGTVMQPAALSRQIGQVNDKIGLGQPGVMESTMATGSNPATSQERVVIYNAHISLETGGVQAVVSKIEALARMYGGYVAQTSLSSSGVQTATEISIRVPQAHFRAAIDMIRTYGKVLDERTTSDDITQQYVDLTARLVNLQKQEICLQEILTMAKTVEDVLNVERELERVRGEIERLQGQINYLEGNSEMSSIAVQLAEPAPPFTPPGIEWGETLQVALTGFFIMTRGLVILIFTTIPLIAIAVPAYCLYKRRTHRPRLHIENPVSVKK